MRKIVENDIDEIIKKYKEIAYYNQEKVLNAFKKHTVSDFYFNPSTGYGYGDIGRDILEEIYSDVFGSETALVRPQIVSGTHAISLCLFACLNKGDEMISLGRPYDTLQSVIGLTKTAPNTLMGTGVKYTEVPLETIENGDICSFFTDKTKMVYIQKSRGYQDRRTLLNKDIQSVVEKVKAKNKDILIFVDNCYGEFVEENEPCHVGADLVAGSLIKNPGGSLAPTGGYIVGKEKLVDLVAERLTAPGLGKELGSSTVDKRYFYQGLFVAPHVVLQALESAIFTSRLCELQGFTVDPHYKDTRGDIIQTIIFNNKEKLLKFCEAIQMNSPVDSQVKPEPAILPGYDVPVIMAAGTFVQGSSIELSVDAPIKEPYTAYLQGGITSESSKAIILNVLKEVEKI